MGLYNELVIKRTVGVSTKPSEITIQFKWGRLWDFKYNIGDEIHHKEGDCIGTLDVPGLAQEDEQYFYYRVTLDNWRIISALPISEAEYVELDDFVTKL